MSLSVSWRRPRNTAVETRISEALQSIMYIVKQTGRSEFLIKQECVEKKMTVFLGDPHTCTCSVFRKEKELCVHIIWLLLKKFRVPAKNPIVHQLGLDEREINAVLRGHVTKTSAGVQLDDSSEELPATETGQRPVSPGDVCPICQDKMIENVQRLTCCKHSCGKTVHLKCMNVTAEHQKSQGQEILECPLCHGTFCTYLELNNEFYSRARPKTKLTKEFTHDGTTCSNCQMSPITGKCFKCTSCTNTFLCNTCFKNNAHSHHNFDFKQHTNNHWRAAAVRSLSNSSLPPTVVTDLQQREITADDYELFLQLDRPPSTTPITDSSPRRAMSARRPPLPPIGTLPPFDHDENVRNTSAKRRNLRSAGQNRNNVPSLRIVSPTSMIVSGHNFGMTNREHTNNRLPLNPSTPPSQSKMTSTLPDIEADQQPTTAHQDMSADSALPKFGPNSSRDRVLSGIRRPADKSLRAASQLASINESDDFSSQAASVLSCGKHTDNDVAMPKPADNTKMPHRVRILSSIRKTPATSRKQLASISETDDLSVNANSLLQNENSVPDNSKVPHTKHRILSGIRKPQTASARETNKLASICEADNLIPDVQEENAEDFALPELEQDSSKETNEASTRMGHTASIHGRPQLTTVFETDECDESAMPVLGSTRTKVSKRKGRLLPGRPQRTPPSIHAEAVSENRGLTLPILEPDSNRVADMRARVLSNGIRQPIERAPTASVHGKKTDISLPILEPDRNRVADSRARVLSNGVRQPMPQSNEKPRRTPSSFYGRRLYRYTTVGTEIHLEEIAREENINLPILEPDRSRVADMRPRVLSNGIREPMERAPTASSHGRKNAKVTLPKLESDSRRVTDSRARVLSNGIRQPIERAPTASVHGRKTDFALPNLESDSSGMANRRARILSGRQSTTKHRLQSLPKLTSTAERKKSGRKLTAHLTYERLPQLPKRNKDTEDL